MSTLDELLAGLTPGQRANVDREHMKLTAVIATPPTAAGANAEDRPACFPESRRYSVERHGYGWAIYQGRDMFHHGLNLGQLTECSEGLPELIELALNSPPSPEDDATKVPADLAHEIWAAAQTAPGEGIEDAVGRIAALIAEDDGTVRDAARYRYIRDFPPRARARRDGNTKPTLNDMWVAAFLRPQTEAIPQMDILEGELLDARVDAAIAAAESGE